MTVGKTIQVNGVWLPPPTKFSVETNDIDAFAYRVEQNAQLVRQLIGTSWKLQVEWSRTKIPADFFELFKFLRKLPEKVTVKFMAPTGQYETANMYRTAQIKTELLWILEDDIPRKIEYENLVSGFVETEAKNYAKL